MTAEEVDGLRCVYCAEEQDAPDDQNGEMPAVPTLEEMAEAIEEQRGRLEAARARREELRAPYDAALAECRALARRLAEMQRAMFGSKRAYEIRRALDAAGIDYRAEPVIAVKVYEGHRLFLLAGVGASGTGLYICKPDKSGRYAGTEYAVLLKAALAAGYDPDVPRLRGVEPTARSLSDVGLLAWAARGSGSMGSHSGALRPRRPPEGGRWRWLKIVEQEALSAPAGA